MMVADGFPRCTPLAHTFVDVYLFSAMVMARRPCDRVSHGRLTAVCVGMQLLERFRGWDDRMIHAPLGALRGGTGGGGQGSVQLGTGAMEPW